MWKHLHNIAKFTGLEKDWIDNFPRQRKRGHFSIEESCHKNLLEVYEPLINEQKSWPECIMRPPRSNEDAADN